jgi:HAD superfamily hydrolase (TIGR01509 family)
MPKAYLFDLDGTLVYTDPLHLDLWKTILSTYGIELTESLYHEQIRGKSDTSIWQAFGVGTDQERAHWTQWKEHEFERRVMETIPVEGGKEFIQQLERVAVVTNSNQKTATLLLSRLGIDVSVLVTADCCPEPKPSPRPYLMAMEKLGVVPEDTVIFEDSPVGIQSALAAKPSQVYVIRTGHVYNNFILSV